MWLLPDGDPLTHLSMWLLKEGDPLTRFDIYLHILIYFDLYCIYRSEGNAERVI